MDMAMQPRTHARAGAAVPDGVAGALGRLAYVLVRPVRYRRLCRRTIAELGGLEGRLLQDIGIDRWQIATEAHALAARHLPERGGAGEALAGLLAAVARALRASSRPGRRAGSWSASTTTCSRTSGCRATSPWSSSTALPAPGAMPMPT
jgi:uncharacterized protein YjiS (DUF1127 family)